MSLPTPYEVPVERGKVREFAWATLADDPAYVEDPQPLTPPTFLMTDTFWTAPENWARVEPPMDPHRTVHGSIEFEFHGPPPRAGTTLTAQARLESDECKPRSKGGELRFVTTVTEYRDADGRVVAERRTTGIEIGGDT